MKAWSEKYVDIKFDDFWTFRVCTYQARQTKAKVIKCVFSCYPEWVKGYKLSKIDLRASKFIISKNVTFDDTRMEMK